MTGWSQPILSHAIHAAIGRIHVWNIIDVVENSARQAVLFHGVAEIAVLPSKDDERQHDLPQNAL